MEQTIRSVLNQTYRNWEWIIIDDGSTDNTKDIVNSHKDERIHYYYQEHGGIDSICATHNKALGLSRGEFVAPLDGDDLWPEYKLDKQLEGFLDDAVVLSYWGCCLIAAGGKKVDYVRVPRDERISRNDPVGAALQNFFLKANSFIYNPTVLIRRSALERIGGFVAYRGLAHDFPTWCRLSLEGKFAPVLSCLGYWRKHANSITFHNAGYRFENKIQFIKDFVELYEKKFESMGGSLTKEKIYLCLDQRLQSFLEHFPYDRAMLLANMGMFQDAEEEFGKFLKKNASVKNRGINYLFLISRLIHYDIVNPSRRLKEKFARESI